MGLSFVIFEPGHNSTIPLCQKRWPYCSVSRYLGGILTCSDFLSYSLRFGNPWMQDLSLPSSYLGFMMAAPNLPSSHSCCDSVTLLDRWFSSGLWLSSYLTSSSFGSLIQKWCPCQDKPTPVHLSPPCTVHDLLPVDLALLLTADSQSLTKVDSDFPFGRKAILWSRSSSLSCSVALVSTWSLRCLLSLCIFCSEVKPCPSRMLHSVNSRLTVSADCSCVPELSVDFYCWSS